MRARSARLIRVYTYMHIYIHIRYLKRAELGERDAERMLWRASSLQASDDTGHVTQSSAPESTSAHDNCMEPMYI